MEGIVDRDLVIFELLENGKSKVDNSVLKKDETEFLRERFNVEKGDYTFILVGKDGGEKLRKNKYVPISELFSLIDSMPMRQEEMRKKANKSRI